MYHNGGCSDQIMCFAVYVALCRPSERTSKR